MFNWLKKRYWEWALAEAKANKAKADINYHIDMSAAFALAENYYEEKLGRVQEVDKPLPAKYVLVGAVESERSWLGNSYWNSDNTIFQDEAWNGKYKDIQLELDDINAKVVFSD